MAERVAERLAKHAAEGRVVRLNAWWPTGRGEWLALAAIVALAALLRMGWPGLTEFKRDEAQLYALALDLAEFKAFPLRGISSSVGLPNSALSVYVFALPLLAWRSPVAATLWVGLLNTASVGLAYALARRYFGPRAAVAGALLYAAAPWAVIYSRKIWAQDLLPFFVTLYGLSGLLGLVEGRGRWLAAHVALLVVAAQIHFSGLALAPVTALWVLLFRRRVAWRALGVGAALAALTLLPLAAYALMRAAGEASGGVPQLFTRPLEVSADSFALAAMVVMGTDVRGLAGPVAFRAFEATLPNFTPLLWLGGALVLAGLGLALWRWFRAPCTPAVEAGLALAVWLVAPVLVFVPHTTPVFAHYFIILFPAPFLLAGLAVQAALARWRAWPWAALAALAASQVWLALALLRFVGTQATPGAFGTPLAHLLAVAQAAREAAAGGDIVVVAEGDDPGVEDLPAVFDVLLRGAPHRFVDGCTTAVLPAERSAVVLWPASYGWPVSDLYRQWGGGSWAAEVALRQGEGAVAVAAGPAALPEVPRLRAASALLANGAEVLGHAEAEGGWQLWWRAPGPQPGEHYHLFAHLYDTAGGAGGTRVGQVDAATYAAAAWRPGDLVVSRFALPPGGAEVRAGMYAYPSLAPVPVLDAQGNPAGEWVAFARP